MSSENRSYLTSIAIGFAISITCIAILLRLLARRVQKLPLGADDYVIIAGALFTIGNACIYIVSDRNGNGRHLTTIPPKELVIYSKANYASEQVYGVAITLIKVSVLLFYRRIFPTAQFRLWTNIVGALVIAWLLVNNLTAAFQCSPIDKAWLIETPGHCIDPLRFVVGLQSLNLALDVIILALPVSAVWRLQMSLRKRISVAGIFLLGGLSVVIAIIRLIAISSANLDDITWYDSIVSWTAIEPAIEVLSVSLPVMAPFLQMRKFLAELRTSFRSFLSSPRKSESSTTGTFYEISESNKILSPERERWETTAVASHKTPEPDHIPLGSIMVTDHLEVC